MGLVELDDKCGIGDNELLDDLVVSMYASCESTRIQTQNIADSSR